MAGYADRMDRFFSDVPGLSSRIGHHIDFPDYSLDELMAIAQLMARQQRYRFSPEAEKAFQDYLARRMEQPRFANGRSVRNTLDRLRMRHANRLWEMAESGKGPLTKGDPGHHPSRRCEGEPGIRRRDRGRPGGDTLEPVSDRVVLARRTAGFTPFQWTGAEPEGLDDLDTALALGACWEGDELVTYNLDAFRHGFTTFDEGYLEDND